MSQTVYQIRQEQLEKEAALYGKLDRQIQKQIQTLKEQKAHAEKMKEDKSSSEACRLVWNGMETAYSNALSELELAYDRAHYNS